MYWFGRYRKSRRCLELKTLNSMMLRAITLCILFVYLLWYCLMPTWTSWKSLIWVVSWAKSQIKYRTKQKQIFVTFILLTAHLPPSCYCLCFHHLIVFVIVLLFSMVSSVFVLFCFILGSNYSKKSNYVCFKILIMMVDSSK